MWWTNSKRIDDLEAAIADLQKKIEPPTHAGLVGTKPVTTKTRWGALGTVVVFAVVFGFIMYVSIVLGPGKDNPKEAVALGGAFGVGVSVVASNVTALLNEWERPRDAGFESWMNMIAFGAGLVGAALVLISVL
ncbi:hypothetical protein [Curtobacterium sp. VKM Ac-1376]|uniref:hypothetical protein n=1 Tax=Curtobacterium sp. VKM Ac-1376 TaxID=123312 RepID=UPI00188BEF66|nr:hypothetical protein [Curtobacterium sp. VKM Ac-1376]MBF4613763.1 hypothetical protein [Curtobacterium sp. VKM Ac-1376]